jgi:hypothetical protein
VRPLLQARTFGPLMLQKKPAIETIFVANEASICLQQMLRQVLMTSRVSRNIERVFGFSS